MDGNKYVPMSQELKQNEIWTGVSKDQATPRFIHYCSLFGCDVVLDGDSLSCTSYKHYEHVSFHVKIRESILELNFERGTCMSGFLDASRFIRHCFQAELAAQPILPFDQVRIRSALLDADEIYVEPGTERVVLEQTLVMATKNYSSRGRYEGILHLTNLSSQDNMKPFMVEMLFSFTELFNELRNGDIHMKRCIVAFMANLLDSPFHDQVASWIHVNQVEDMVRLLLAHHVHDNGYAQLVRECNRVLGML
jgi:hypothetical protein